jgi:transketolase
MDYQRTALEVRRNVLEMIHKAQTSHIGSNLSCIDLLAVLHDKVLRFEGPKDGGYDYHDKLIYSKGWVAATAYAFLARHKIIPEKDLETYCADDSKYIGLVEPTVKGIIAAGGAMGHGLPMGVGMAMSYKKNDSDDRKVYVLMSDGEMQCGTTWESALLGAHHNLDNLMVIVDYNKLQAMGRTNEVLNLDSLPRKWNAFNWEVRQVDGHNPLEIERALTSPPLKGGAPIAVIAHTVKGRGVSFMEDKLEYHYKNISDEEYEKALEELST